MSEQVNSDRKSLIKSILDIEGGIALEHAESNFRNLEKRKIDLVDPALTKILQFVRSYNSQYMSVPSIQTVEDYCGSEKDLEVLEICKDIRSDSIRQYIRTSFCFLADQILENDKKFGVIKLLEDTKSILKNGLEEKDKYGKKKQFKGYDDAIGYLESGVAQIEAYYRSSRDDEFFVLNSQKGAQEEYDRYIQKHLDKSLGWGTITGITNIDSCIRGIQKGQMWVHAAFAGQLKTTFAMNWAYNVITRYQRNVFYASFEMTKEEIQAQLYTIHSANGKFRAQGKAPLSYQKVKSGNLTEEELEFYKEILTDLSCNPEYGRFHCWVPTGDPTIAHVRLGLESLTRELRKDGNLPEHQRGFALAVLDHAGLMRAPDTRDPNKTEQLNQVFRAAKQLALTFNQGEGIPLLLLHQLNREGLKSAEKNSGKHELHMLSYSNEAERSADIVTTTFLDEARRKAQTPKFQCLKHRGGAPFEPFDAYIDWEPMRLRNLETDDLIPQDISDIPNMFV